MGRIPLPRNLAAAGLALVTGTAALSIALIGVGPLGEVAAGVRGIGASVSRGVLSVVMPNDAPEESGSAESSSFSDHDSIRASTDTVTTQDDGDEAAVAQDEASDPPPDSGVPDAAGLSVGQPEHTLTKPLKNITGGTEVDAAGSQPTAEPPTKTVTDTVADTSAGTTADAVNETNDLTEGLLR